MRAAVAPGVVQLSPGRTTTVEIEVTNTLEVIDGITAVLDAGLGLGVTADPPLLPLFPEGSGTISLALTPSPHFPAGTHELLVELRSAADPSAGVVERLRAEVEPDPSASVTALPAVSSGRRRAAFSIVVDNTGNLPLEVSLAATDPDRALRVRFAAPVVTVPPGQSADTSLTVTGRQHWLGNELSRQVTIVAADGEVEASTRAVFRQRPVLARGVRTALVLAAIVAVWAGIFVLALDKALAGDPLTKQVPASFYAASAAKDHGQLQALGRSTSYGLASAEGAPAGAVPKTGVVIGVGGTVAGTVDAKSTGAGIGRITVEATRDSPRGEVLVSSAATASDGSYSIEGLLPGRYRLRFSATGYKTVWAAKAVNVRALGLTANVDATIAGRPGSISGTVQTGQTPSPPVKVTVEPQQGRRTTPIAVVTTNGAGHYTVPRLPTPGTYDLSFSAAGYQTGTDNEELTGGQAEVANTVTLTAADGTLSGTVSDGGRPVGGVTVKATADGHTYTSATPTTGAVGRFVLSNLPTPATYLVTFSKAGFGTRSQAVILAPGQAVDTLTVSMAGGAGDIDGQVDGGGGGLGGAKVSVDGGPKPLTTRTLTAGQVGSFALSGLPTPGTYTLTFSDSGYVPQTIAVHLGSTGAAIVPTVRLQRATGTVTGSVQGVKGPLTGVAVAITNGQTKATTTTSSSPAGGFSFTGLSAGAYALTFSESGEKTAVVTVILKPGEVTPPIVVTLQNAPDGS